MGTESVTVREGDLSVNELRKFCSEYSISLTFISKTLGLHSTTAAGWKDSVPDKYKGQIVNIMISIKHLRNGTMVEPTTTYKSKETARKRINLSIDILKTMEDPLTEGVIGLLRSVKPLI